MRLLLIAFNLSRRNVWLQTFAEVHGAYNCIANRHDNKYDCDDGEGGQGLPHRNVLHSMGRLVHTKELEDEVC